MSIPALMVVKLELVGGEVGFSPPLTPHSSLPSVPEIVSGWLDGYLATTAQLPRVSPDTQVFPPSLPSLKLPKIILFFLNH